MFSRPGRTEGGTLSWAAVTELGAFLLPAVPLLGLLLMLLLGRYPGCEAIVRLSERIAGPVPSRRKRTDRPALPKPPRSFAPGGGLLIALGHAQRPPPLPA
jgi:hypothetical protein